MAGAPRDDGGREPLAPLLGRAREVRREDRRAHAWSRGRAVYEAAGAEDCTLTPPYPTTHNLGTCRMSERPADGVVNGFGQAHDVPNLFVSDGSVFTTGAAANPTLTIVALAIRQAEYLGEQVRAGAF